MPEKMYSVALYTDGKSYSVKGFSDSESLENSTLKMIYSRGQGSQKRMVKLWQNQDSERTSLLAQLVTQHISRHEGSVDMPALEKELAQLNPK